STGFANPAWTLYQMRLLRALLNREGFGRDRVPDLFFTNFKQIDEVSHAYFLQSYEMKQTIPFSDAALAGIVRWLNNNVGERRWVLAMTADHGVGPKFTKVGAWAIDMQELQIDIAVRFQTRITEIFDSQRPQGFWVDRAALRRSGITRTEIANFLLDYRMRNNVADDLRVPKGYRGMMDERLFRAAWPTGKITSMSDCGAAQR
ncbi:MAG: alkaline phosphatase family protein, partial [Actinomycetota bacterium]